MKKRFFILLAVVMAFVLTGCEERIQEIHFFIHVPSYGEYEPLFKDYVRAYNESFGETLLVEKYRGIRLEPEKVYKVLLFCKEREEDIVFWAMSNEAAQNIEDLILMAKLGLVPPKIGREAENYLALSLD